MKRLLIVSALSVLVSGCGLGTDLDVQAYNTCLSRHPQDEVVCEGPRQAYEADPPAVQARSAGVLPVAGHGYEQGSASNPLTPAPSIPAQCLSPPVPTDNRPTYGTEVEGQSVCGVRFSLATPSLR